ncbi:hypothetical protein [Neisseria lactamica]|uniref:hypothetical protein n=1 Tax=Neisseria lactamica TaxID=486 RepID=UPI0018652A14|nr:hypothetical protein [Neisseria lactamica]
MGVGWASAHQSHHLRQSLRSHHFHRIKGFGEPSGFGGFGFWRGMADLAGAAEEMGLVG